LNPQTGAHRGDRAENALGAMSRVAAILRPTIGFCAWPRPTSAAARAPRSRLGRRSRAPRGVYARAAMSPAPVAHAREDRSPYPALNTERLNREATSPLCACSAINIRPLSYRAWARRPPPAIAAAAGEHPPPLASTTGLAVQHLH
jgi:hypothetical protein